METLPIGVVKFAPECQLKPVKTLKESFAVGAAVTPIWLLNNCEHTRPNEEVVNAV